MTKPQSFDDAMKAAEDALLAKRGRNKPKMDAKAKAYAKAYDKAYGKANTTADSHDFVRIDGVPLASRDYVDRMDKQIRDDLNDVLDSFEIPNQVSNQETKPLEITIRDNSGVVGSIKGATHFQMPTLIKAASIPQMNIMLKGEAGSGKSTACRQLADGMGLDFGYIKQTLMPHDVVGVQSQLDGKFYGTAFTRIYEHGGVCVFEEMDGWSPNATLVLNPALANGYLELPDGRFIERHPDCILVACTNTWGTGPTAQYVGRNKLDDAFIDRFGVKLDWRYDNDLERAAAGNDEVVDVVQTARANARRAGVRVIISPRSSIDIAKLVAAGFSMRDAINMNFGSSLDPDQRKMVLDGCDV